tara:strand:- start:3588 stop:4154 length:567 start_codon:yes stop_codon:yes gene_type:complete
MSKYYAVINLHNIKSGAARHERWLRGVSAVQRWAVENKQVSHFSSIVPVFDGNLSSEWADLVNHGKSKDTIVTFGFDDAVYTVGGIYDKEKSFRVPFPKIFHENRIPVVRLQESFVSGCEKDKHTDPYPGYSDIGTQSEPPPEKEKDEPKVVVELDPRIIYWGSAATAAAVVWSLWPERRPPWNDCDY